MNNLIDTFKLLGSFKGAENKLDKVAALKNFIESVGDQDWQVFTLSETSNTSQVLWRSVERDVLNNIIEFRYTRHANQQIFTKYELTFYSGKNKHHSDNSNALTLMVQLSEQNTASLRNTLHPVKSEWLYKGEDGIEFLDAMHHSHKSLINPFMNKQDIDNLHSLSSRLTSKIHSIVSMGVLSTKLKSVLFTNETGDKKMKKAVFQIKFSEVNPNSRSYLLTNNIQSSELNTYFFIRNRKSKIKLLDVRRTNNSEMEASFQVSFDTF